jgi:hypothetical protein
MMGLADHHDSVQGAVELPVTAAVQPMADDAALAAPSEVLVSRTVKELVAGSGLAFTDRGSHPLKGVPDEWHLYAVG